MARRFEVQFIGDTKNLERAYGRAGTGAEGFAGRAKKAAKVASAAVLASAVATGKAAIDFESAFAGVRKTVDATEAEYKRLSDGIRRMAREIPVAATELAGIAEAAGQLGIQKQNILAFTRTIADLGVSSNLAGEEGAAMLARFANITKMPQGDFDRLGSTIVALGNAGASTEAEIAEMALRLAGAGEQIGLTEAQTLGFANALSSVGIEAEAGGSAISKVFVDMAVAVKRGGSDLDAFAKVAGVSGGEFRRVFERDAANATLLFIEGLARLKREGGDVFGVLEDLGFSNVRVRDALLRASGAGDLFRESLRTGSQAWKDNNALTNEAEQRYKTAASQLQILKNTITDVGISIGTALLPGVTAGAQGLVAGFTTGADAAQDLYRAVTASGLAMAALGGIVGALTGRMVGLAAAFAVTKLISFVGFVRDIGAGLTTLATVADIARAKIRGLNLATASTGIGALAVILGTVAGAILGFRQRTDEATISQRELAGSVREFHSALDQIAGAHIEAKQLALNEKAAELELAAAYRERRDLVAQGITQGPHWEQVQLRIAQAKVTLERATRASSNSERDWGDDVREGSVAAQDHIGKLRGLAVAARRNRDQTVAEVEALKDRIVTLQQSGAPIETIARVTDELRDKQRQLRGENGKLEDAEKDVATAQRELRDTAREAADKVGTLRGKIRDLTKLPKARLQIFVELAFEGFPRLQKPQDLLKPGRDSGGPELLGPIKEQAANVVRANRDQILPNMMGGGQGIVGIGRMLQGMGYQVGEHPAFGGVGRHRSGSLHYSGRALDINADGRPGGEGAWLDRLYAMLRPLNPTELLWRVEGHHDHLHLGFQRGGVLPGFGNGDKVPVLAEPGEGFINKRAVRALGGPAMVDAINAFIPRFQSGGMVGIGGLVDLAQGAGFRGTGAARMAAEAMAESGGNPRARGDGGQSLGLTQIHTPSWPDLARRFNLFNPLQNFRAARQVFLRSGRSFGPWHADHRPHMAAALRALRGGGSPGGTGGGSRGGGFLPDGGVSVPGTPAELGLPPNALPPTTSVGKGGVRRPTPGMGQPGSSPTPTPAEAPELPGGVFAGGLWSNWLELELAQAGLTPGTEDDLAALQRQKVFWEARLADAQTLTPDDPRDDIEAARGLKGVIDAIASLDTTLQETNQRLQEENSLLRQQKLDDDRRFNTLMAQKDVFIGGLYTLVSRHFGRVQGPRAGFPSAAGLTARR